ncbi:NAD-dependent epimerase/dehydratase family protein [Enterococcus sp. AD013-P3]|uniref:NAD-dependent epimerase/dehydratase family protein n=1 Tax=Enterococcus sp. AD013-P3 TaxID=3411036 RepID=UPI003B95F74C
MLQNSLYQKDLQKVIENYPDWEKLSGKSLLMIGASGMIGSFLVDVLMLANQQKRTSVNVYAMGRNRRRLEQYFADYLPARKFQIIEGDVTTPLPKELKADYLIHGASNTHPKAYATDPIGTIMTNLMGTEQVLKHAAATNAERTLFLSTVEIYGENRSDTEYFDEAYCGYIDCNTLRAGYPEGKRVSESLCQAYISKYGIDIVIPRLSRVFGPTMLTSDTKASSQFILNAARNEDIVLKSEGTQHFSYVYVGDAVLALLHLLTNGSSGEAYNVAGGKDYDLRLKDLAAKIAAVGKGRIVFQLPDELEQKGFSKANKALLDITKIQKNGFASIFDLNTALSHTVKIVKDELKNV